MPSAVLLSHYLRVRLGPLPALLRGLCRVSNFERESCPTRHLNQMLEKAAR